MNTDSKSVDLFGVRGENKVEMIPLNSLALSIYQVVFPGLSQQRVLGQRKFSHGVKPPLPAFLRSSLVVIQKQLNVYVLWPFCC